jgi:arylsulfatase A-like enzyme
MPPGDYATMYPPQDMRPPRNFMPLHPFNTGQMTTRDEKLAPWPRTQQVIRQQTAQYYGMISHLDHQIGRVLATVRQQGLQENTIVIFTSDHGLGMGSHGLLGKQNLYEHSMKAPMIVGGPGIGAGSSNALVYLHDLFPTICDMAGVNIPAGTEGADLMPIMEGETEQVRSSLFTAYGKWIRAVRDQKWKLIRWPQLNRSQLFDLETDPYELRDLAASDDHQPVVKRLTDLLRNWQLQVGDKQALSVDQPIPAEIDLSDQARKPDRPQSARIVEN